MSSQPDFSKCIGRRMKADKMETGIRSDSMKIWPKSGMPEVGLCRERMARLR